MPESYERGVQGISESATIEEIRAALLKAQTQAEPALAIIGEMTDRHGFLIKDGPTGVALHRLDITKAFADLNRLIALLQIVQQQMARISIETMSTPKSLSFSPVKNDPLIIS